MNPRNQIAQRVVPGAPFVAIDGLVILKMGDPFFFFRNKYEILRHDPNDDPNDNDSPAREERMLGAPFAS